MKGILIGIGVIIGLVLGICLGGILSYKYLFKYFSKRVDRAEQMADKHLAIVNLLSMWLQNKEENLQIETYLKERNIKKIAIYGMSFVGERLYDELEKSDIEICFCIDKNANNIYKDVEIYAPEDNFDTNIDAIIVTAFTYFEEIENDLKLKVSAPIISVDDIIYSL